MLLMSSQYPSEIHPELHPAVVVWPVVPGVPVDPVVPVLVVTGSRHEHSVQY